MALGSRLYAELRGDRVIWAILVLLAMFSVLLVYSATGKLAYSSQGGNTEFYLLKHLLILGFGLIITYCCFLMHYERYHRLAPYLLVIIVPLLLYTLFAGSNINDARRWIQVPGVGITFQTSDFAKIALVLFVARELTKKQEYIKDFQSAFVPIIMPILIVCGIIAPADLSTAIVLFTTCLLMMFIGRVSLQYVGLLIVSGVVVFAMLYIIGDLFPGSVRTDTWSERIKDFMNQEELPYQVQQAKIAIANGGWLGVGPGNSMQRNFLPNPFSDFIYAVIIEEYGLLGGGVILLLYVMLFVRVTRLVTNSPKTFGAIVALGLSLLLVLQALTNMAVSVNLIPVAGLSLPLVGLGGTSLMFTCITFGIILSVSKYVEASK
jgi:cell division protein FtsW